MQPNPFFDKVSTGGVAFGGWLGIPTAATAEAVAMAGFDYVVIDRQHGLAGVSDMVAMLAAITHRGPTPLVRVPENTPANISTALDSGAMGVIVPLVNSPEQAAAAVASCRYPPEGDRSFGPIRVGPVEGPDYIDRANQQVQCIPMIETAAALERLDDILSLPGVDTIYVGPSDLAISLGCQPGSEDPALLEAFAQIVASCQQHGVTPGIQASPSLVEDRLDKGFRMVTVISDLAALREVVSRAAAMARDLISDASGPAPYGESLY